jgi:hypothetical protein
VNAIEALSRSNVPFMPNTLVTGGGGSIGGVIEGLGSLLMQKVGPGSSVAPGAPASSSASLAPSTSADAAKPADPPPPPSPSKA